MRRTEQFRASLLVGACATTLALCAGPSAAMEGIPVWGSEKKKVESIWNDAMVQGGREEAVRKVLALAADPNADIYAREYAVTKLADIGATEVTDEIKELVDSLSWMNDRERSLVNHATATYHKLRYLREPDPARKYELLLDTVRNAKGAAPIWAIDELIRTDHREAMPVIAERIGWEDTTERGRARLRLCELKFEVMAAGENLPAVLEQVAEGKYAGLEGFSSNERERMQSWARKELRLRRGQPLPTSDRVFPSEKPAATLPAPAPLPGPRWPLVIALGVGGLFLGFALAALIFRRRRA